MYYISTPLLLLASSPISTLLQINDPARSTSSTIDVNQKGTGTCWEDIAKDIQWPPIILIGKQDHTWRTPKCVQPGECCFGCTKIADGDVILYIQETESGAETSLTAAREKHGIHGRQTNQTMNRCRIPIVAWLFGGTDWNDKPSCYSRAEDTGAMTHINCIGGAAIMD